MNILCIYTVLYTVYIMYYISNIYSTVSRWPSRRRRSQNAEQLRENGWLRCSRKPQSFKTGIQRVEARLAFDRHVRVRIFAWACPDSAVEPTSVLEATWPYPGQPRLATPKKVRRLMMKARQLPHLHQASTCEWKTSTERPWVANREYLIRLYKACRRNRLKENATLQQLTLERVKGAREKTF